MATSILHGVVSFLPSFLPSWRFWCAHGKKSVMYHITLRPCTIYPGLDLRLSFSAFGRDLSCAGSQQRLIRLSETSCLPRGLTHVAGHRYAPCQSVSLVPLQPSCSEGMTITAAAVMFWWKKMPYSTFLLKCYSVTLDRLVLFVLQYFKSYAFVMRYFFIFYGL